MDVVLVEKSEADPVARLQPDLVSKVLECFKVAEVVFLNSFGLLFLLEICVK